MGKAKVDKTYTKTKTYQSPKMVDGKLSYTLYDSNGDEIGKTLVAPGTDMSNVGNKYFSKNASGTWDMSDTPKASVSLDEKTGKITVSAPKLAIQNESFKSNIEDTLKALSKTYKQNKDYKFSVTNESGENEEKSIQDVINDLNKEFQNEDGTYNYDSIGYMATAAVRIEQQKAAHSKNTGLDFSDNDIMRMNTIAVGPDLKDTNLQLISNLPEAWWLRDIDTYDKDTGYAQYGDIMENAYNKEKISSEDMIKLWAALENYFVKGDYSDKEEYIRNVATARFIDATQPNMSWIRDVTENVMGFLNGIGGYATNLGTTGVYAIEKIGMGILELLGVPEEYFDVYGENYGDIYISRGGNQFAAGMPTEKVDGKIGRLHFDGNGVPTYIDEDINGTVDNPKTTGQLLRNIFKENQAVIRKDIQYLHASESSWDMVGYAITNLAALISAGNNLSDLFSVGAGWIASKATTSLASSATSFADVATSLFASGSALGYGATASEVANIVSGVGTIYDIAAATGKTASFLNFIGQAVASAKSTELIFGVLGESIAEAIVGDPDRFVEVLDNREIDTDTKNYLIETYVGNAVGWGVGAGVGKFLMNAGETVKGRAISANLSRRIFKVQNAVGDAFDRAILTIRRVEGDTLADKIKSLYEKGGKYAKKQANAMAANAMLREIRGVIADSDSIKVAGKSADEIEESLKDIELKILQLKDMENSLNSMQRQGMDIVQGWLKDDGSGIKEVTESFYEKASSLSKLEREAGGLFVPTKGAVTDLSSGKTLRLFSQTTTNYIKATEKIDYINAYLKKFEHAEGITEDILSKINGYKKELPELQEMVNKFVNNASQELKLAADNFIDADRKWWAQFENLRSSLGLTSLDELKGMRGSGLWGTNGELYARATRKADLSEYVVKHRDGASNVKMFDDYEQYMAGATGDFADPMGEMQIALYDAGNKQAYRSFARGYDALTGSLETKVSGADVELVKQMKNGLTKAYKESSEKFLSNIVEKIHKDDAINDVIKNLKVKVDTKVGQFSTKKSIRTSTEKMQKKLVAVDDTNASGYIARLDPESTNNLWNEFYDVSPRQLMADGEQFVPKETKRYIYRKARELGVNVSKDDSLVDTYDAVNKSLTGAATPDASFEDTIKRSIMQRNEVITKNKGVQDILTEANQVRYTAKYETFLKDLNERYAEFSRQYDIATEELQVAGGQQTEAYIQAMTRSGSPQRAAIDEMCRFYGLEGDPNAIRYFALSAFVDNEKKYKSDLFLKLREAVKKEHPRMPGDEQDRIAQILSNGIAETMEEEFNDMYLIVKELNPDAVHDTTEKMMDEISRITKEINEAEGNRYTGEKNIIAMRNAQGQVEFYKTDPLLAHLMNFQYKQEKMNGLTQAMYNTNYLWAKLFRLGTTAINLKSMVSQSFRDPINMFIGGGAYKFGQRHIDEMVDVFGDDVVNFYKINEPEVLGRLQKQAAETGKSLQELAIQREMSLGKALSPAATETYMYKSLSTAKKARLNGVQDIYDETASDKFVRGVSKVEDIFGKGNEWRETTLRNISYSNGFSTALKRGYSVSQARTYATFVMNEATTNFTRMTNHLTALKDTVPYFGSAINGSKSFFKLLSMDPVGVIGRLTGGLIIPTVALAAYSLSDEENRKVYKSVPEYQKEDALVFVVGGQVFSIPIPQELGSFVAPFRQTVDNLYGVGTNTFPQLLWNDILGFSPIELTGFADLDFAKLEQSSPGFMDRIGKGIAKMWSQLAPAPLKSGLEIVTGVDPYTGKEIDKSYLDYDEDGNPIVKDYQSGELAKLLNKMFRSWGLTSSAPVVQNILSNIVGQASVDVVDFLVSLGTQVPNGGWNLTGTEKELSQGEGYNPFYVLGERLTSPITVAAYDEAQSAWKSEVAKLYNMKREILNSDAWKEYLEAKRSTSDPDKLKNINSSKKDIVEKYFETVKNVVNNLQANYGEEFTAAKYATVLSLMTMNEQTLDAGSYGDYLKKEEYKTARAQAIQTMIKLGFQSTSTTDVLGKYSVDSDGNVIIKTYHPLAILQLDDVSGAALRSQSNKQHYAVIKTLVNDAGLFDERSNYQKLIKEANSNKNYTKSAELAKEYNEKVIKAVGAYIEQYTPESVLQGDTLDFLKEYIIVPSDFQVNKYGKHISALGNGAYLSDAFKEPYLKYIFNYGENKL